MASTDEKCPATGSGDESPSSAESPHGERRRSAREILSEQRTHLDRLEHELTEQLQSLADEVAQSVRLAETAAGAEGESTALAALESQFDALNQQFATLDAECDVLRKELEEARLQRGRLEQELRVHDALLKEAQTNEEARRVELSAARGQLADGESQLSAARERQASLERELSEQRELAAASEEETKAQRRRIAREFKQQRAERLAEFDQRKAELQALAETNKTGLEEKVTAAQAELLANIRELDEAREALARRESEAEQAQGEIESLRSEAAALGDQLEQLKTERAREIEQLANSTEPSGDSAVVQQLTDERDRLTQQLADAEARLSEQATADADDSREASDLRRRFEMAVEEVRELKRSNAELETKLRSRGSAPATAAPSGGLDWEAQKQRLLASLEADDDDDDEAVAKRASIEGTVRITDQVVEQKDEEIAALKQSLEEYARAAPAAAAATAATAELLDHDEVIRQEREKLAQLQAEWREKISKAEIDVSVERAKIARDRAQLEEKARQFQAEQDRRDDAADPSKPTRGRWLARLGLKDIDETK